MLEAFLPFGDHEYVKMCRRRGPPVVEYGRAIRKTSLRKHNQEMCSILKHSRTSSSSLNGMRKDKVSSWYVFFLIILVVLVG
jgi:hypothetical protein